MENYNPNIIENKWQKFWEKNNLNKAEDFGGSSASGKAKFYCLDMFPYPSGAGLHVGHPKGYTATDIISRYKRMQGYNVLHPMGWDAFGLPAENYAIKTKIHPDKSTHQNIKRFKEQIRALGFSYDWTREIDTSSPEYYKWTQWFFLFLYKNGLAYKAKAPVNWCQTCQTVLANEQAQNGKCERCGNEVSQKELEQWFFKITDFNEDLLSGLDKIDWPEPIKIMQRNWIGKSDGWEIEFKIHPVKSRVAGIPPKAELFNRVKVFTTRTDTIFGCTYLVVAPEHLVLAELKEGIENWEEVEGYIKQAKKKTALERQADIKEKTGVRIEGIAAINPANGKEVPIFVADYVLSTYGTGSIMAVPAHDQRDFEFAKKYGLLIKEVIRAVKGTEFLEVYEGEGVLVNSEQFNGMESKIAMEKIGEWLGGKGLAKKKVNYKLRDWLISRQRYWGAPIPIIYCEKCALRDSLGQGQVPVLEKDLPVLLPTDVDFVPKGESPLTKSKSFYNVKCPQCHSKARREVDTMDTFVCSSWYFFRYVDLKNKKEFADRKLIDYWLPVDWYVGGAEHAVLHLLYARFFTKALFRSGLINFDEPFLKLRNVGLILAEGGAKMSKSKGNVVNPDDIIKEYGADTLRVYEMFMGPFEQAIAWDTKSLAGARRFLERAYNLKFKSENLKSTSKNLNLERLLHKTIKKVGEDIEAMKFNTAISALMILVNEMEKGNEIPAEIFKQFLLILAPFAPHIAEQLFSELKTSNQKAKSIFLESWPVYDQGLIKFF